MVWFQCEDCGENLKKPKLPNHFRICSATKLSCIDCGQMFGQESVQGHTQCITEAEKYGPKGQGKVSNGATPKPKNDSKQPDIDIHVGLSERPPWFCSLCNTKATSKQTLLLHADGKKHRAKARAFNASKQPKQTKESAPDTIVLVDNITNDKLPDVKELEQQKVAEMPIAKSMHADPKKENGESQLKQKRKLDASENDVTEKRNRTDATQKENGMVQAKKAKAEKSGHNLLKDDKAVGSGDKEVATKNKIKWKKLIKLALKSNPDRVLKMKKLKKLVLKSLQESGIEEDEQLGEALEQKLSSGSRFRVDGKYVHLVDKE